MAGYNLPGDSQLADLRDSTALIGDRAALDREWQEFGYWYFKGVLPLDALVHFRQPVMDELNRIGVVDAGAAEPVWNGKSMARFPAANMAGYDPFPSLVRSRRWMDFLATPAVEAFFADVLGARADWVAVAELRVNPPNERVEQGLFTFPHQDGFYNEGYRCITAWMPLWPVPKAAGGIALAEGMHRQGYLHDTKCPPRFPIPADAIPPDAWRAADYMPGDVVLFHRDLPHAGQRNRSADRFRVSFDVRCVLPGDPVPVLGHVESATADAVVMRTNAGERLSLRLDADSYVRGVSPGSALRLPLGEVPREYPVGQEILVTRKDDRIVLLREPKY